MSELKKVYILHGWSVDQFNNKKWQPLIESLEKKGIKSIFLKIPGLSSPLNEVWQLNDFVDWLDQNLKSENKVALIGHSFGGQLAIRYTSLHPDKISKLILIDNSGIRDYSLKARIKRFIFLLLAKIGKLFIKSNWARKFIYRLTRQRDYYNAPPLLRRTMSNILEDEIINDLDNITCQTLIIWGEKDTATPLQNAYLVKQKIKKSILHVISDARHSPQFTHVEKTADKIASFL